RDEVGWTDLRGRPDRAGRSTRGARARPLRARARSLAHADPAGRRLPAAVRGERARLAADALSEPPPRPRLLPLAGRLRGPGRGARPGALAGRAGCVYRRERLVPAAALALAVAGARDGPRHEPRHERLRDGRQAIPRRHERLPLVAVEHLHDVGRDVFRPDDEPPDDGAA